MRDGTHKLTIIVTLGIYFTIIHFLNEFITDTEQTGIH